MTGRVETRIADRARARLEAAVAALPWNPPLLLLAAWVTAAAAINLVGVTPDAVVGASPFFCPFRALTGIECPGCGMTRAFVAAAAGDFAEAIHLNPFSIPLLVWTAVEALHVPVPSVLRARSAFFYPVALAVVIVWWTVTRLVPGLEALL